MTGQNRFRGKSVLVTGGTGAFAKKFVGYLIEQQPSRVILFSRDEMKHAALKRELGKVANWLEFRIGDVTNTDDLASAFRGTDIVVHAAAMKHLPECEANIVSSLRVNVEGTLNVCRAFERSSASTLFFLSTDKAPYPSTAYGAQKLIGEKLVVETAKRNSDKRAFVLRYSNVMDSTGAVFHLFKDQLSEGKQITVNGTTMARGFVTQAQVIKTITNLMEIGKGGEIAVLRPRVVKISDLANSMKAIIGNGSVQINEQKAFVGEKDTACLVMSEEIPFCKSIPVDGGGTTILIDNLNRHPSFEKAVSLPANGLWLEDCEILEGAELTTFLKGLI